MHTQRSEADWMRYLHIKRNEGATDQGCSSGISNVCYVLSKIQRLQLQISNSVWEGFVVFLGEGTKCQIPCRWKGNRPTNFNDVNVELVNSCRNLDKNVRPDFGDAAVIH